MTDQNQPDDGGGLTVQPTLTTAVAVHRTSRELAIPDSSDFLRWTDAEAALMEFSKLGTRIVTQAGQVIWQGAPRGVVEAFLSYVKRSGLDPIAKQVYAAEVAGVWTILGAVDGFRLVAERTGQYQGQTPKEWSYDGGKTWSTIPGVPEGMDPLTRPYAARVGVWRAGFRVPLAVTLSFAEFGKMPVDRNGNVKEKDNWNVRPAWMLGIRAETHALRAAFPHELSGIYTREDVEQMVDAGEFPVVTDWKAKLQEFEAKDPADLDKADLAALFAEMKDADAFTPELNAMMKALVGKAQKDSRPPKPGAPGQTGDAAVDAPLSPQDSADVGTPAPAPEAAPTAPEPAAEVDADEEAWLAAEIAAHEAEEARR